MSSKKPFDHIEEKIKQAAENSMPAFDEKAWQAMEAKLDKDKRKRRPFLWWFILPLVLAGAWGIYYMNNSEKKISNNTVEAKPDLQEKNSNLKDLSNTGMVPSEEEQGSKTATSEKAAEATAKTTIVTDNKKLPVSETAFAATIVANDKKPLAKRHSVLGNKKGKVNAIVTDAEPESMEINHIPGNETVDVKEEVIENNKPVQATEQMGGGKSAAPITPTTDLTAKAGEKQAVQTGELKKDEKAPDTKKEKNKRHYKGLYLLAAGGADAGNTKLLSFNNSKVTAKYGIGIGWQFNNRWSVQTGFYATNKKYVAGPGDYKIKPGSPMGAYPIEKIKAACLVYEIPVSVRYNIVSGPSLALYATAGAESYIMQKEKYECLYRYSNYTYEQAWQFSGNRHLFSTAIFSLGIEKPLSSKLSLLAEPSVSIPLSGVGDGRMNIYSSAALLGVKYYPFKK
jgi:hypothetical protein